MAQDYLLLQGMPGTGKTTIIVAAIRVLVSFSRNSFNIESKVFMI